jgi:hypothetical protein
MKHCVPLHHRRRKELLPLLKGHVSQLSLVVIPLQLGMLATAYKPSAYSPKSDATSTRWISEVPE